MAHGKSKSQTNPNGIRSRSNGEERAPRALRKRGKRLLGDCSDEELERFSNVTRKA